MSESRERFSGRDFAEAMSAARKHFRLRRQDIEYEVISTGRVGPTEDVSDVVEIEAWPAEGAVPGSADEPQPDVGYEDHGEARDRHRRGGGGRGRGDDRRGDDRRGDDRRGGGRRGGRGGEGRGGPRHRERRHGGGPEREFHALQHEEFQMPPLFGAGDEEGEEAIIRSLTEALMVGLDLDLHVLDVSEAAVGTRVNLTGSDVPDLLDHEGEGLDALQYLVNRLIQKDGRLDARVSYDADGYREESEARLAEMAREKAEEVLETGKIQKMPPLGPYERRLVHIALAELEGIKTFSKGGGYNRRLHIAPAVAADDDMEDSDENGAENGAADGGDSEE